MSGKFKKVGRNLVVENSPERKKDSEVKFGTKKTFKLLSKVVAAR